MAALSWPGALEERLACSGGRREVLLEAARSPISPSRPGRTSGAGLGRVGGAVLMLALAEGAVALRAATE